jgi:rhodanese-related sulfurtransferase
MNDAREPRRLPVNEAHALVEQGRAVLLDARDTRLYDNAHIKGAQSLPLGVLTATPGRIALGVLPEHPGLLLFYCA